jgi:hypothetical protein
MQPKMSALVLVSLGFRNDFVETRLSEATYRRRRSATAYGAMPQRRAFTVYLMIN